MVFDKIFSSSKDEEESSFTKMPQHLAMTMEGIRTYARQSKEEYSSVCKKSFLILKNLALFQVKSNIPIMTVHVLSDKARDDEEDYRILLDNLAEFMETMTKSELVHTNKIKITIFGKWYDLPSRVIDPIKDLLEETKDYDGFFLNLCINYDGQEEIVDSCRIIARQINAAKILPDAISKDIIKQNSYSSYFLPPDFIIKTGLKQTIPGVLHWDCINAKIHFVKKYWPELRLADLYKALKEF